MSDSRPVRVGVPETMMICLKASIDGKPLEDIACDVPYVTFGSAPDNVVALLASGAVTPHHARIDALKLLITDLGTPAFGLSVNGQRVTSQGLENGDVIDLGRYSFTFFHLSATGGVVDSTKTIKL